MRFNMKNQRERLSGSAMVIVTMLIGSMLVLSFALVSGVTSANKAIKGSKDDLETIYICEAALSEAIYDIANGGKGSLGSKATPIQYGPAGYWVQATDIGDGRTSLVASGRENRAVTRVELIVRANVDANLYRWAAFGRDALNMDSQAKTDSYDSTVGTYADQEVNGSGSNTWANSNGNVGSNAGIVVKQNSKVFGNATPGPGESTSILGSATVSGSTTPSTSEIVLPPLEIPVIASSGSWSVSGTENLASGDHAYDDLTIGGTLNIAGPATIVVTNLVLSSNSEILIDASGGMVEIYVLEDFDMNSNTLIASQSNTPKDVALYLQSDNIIDPEVDVSLDPAAVEFDSNSEIYGTVYAPNAHIEIDSNFQLYGSLVARSVDLDSNSRVHFDEDLRSGRATQSEASFETICWRVLPDNEN